MNRSWTIDFLKEWSPRMSAASLIRLRSRLIRELKGELRRGKTMTLRMKRPFRAAVTLREWGSDLATFDEIVVAEIYKTVVSSLPQVQTVIDLGANIGLASLYFAHYWPSCRLLAVEPNPETFAILESNLASFGRSNRCKALQAAVWNAKAKLSPDQEPGHFSAFAVHEATAVHDTGAVIEGRTMADIINYSGFKAVDLLKVDIEGAEIQLFSGDVGWLSRVSNIAIEFHEGSRENSHFDEVVAAFGFRDRSLYGHTALFSRAS